MIVAQRFRRPNHDDFFELSRLRGGEGLHPELRLLFERAATSPVSDVVIRHDGLLQSGPGLLLKLCRSALTCRSFPQA